MVVGKSKKKTGIDGGWLAVAAVGALLILAIAGLAWTYLTARSGYVELGSDLCPLADGPNAKLLVLVDTTDPLADLTRQEILAKLGETAANAPKGSLIEIRTVRETAPHAQTVFSLCNPGNGSDLVHLTGNPRLALEQWREGFQEPLSKAMNLSLGGGEAKTSPIMGGIQALSVAALSTEKDRALPVRFIIISDMLENTPHYSLYREGTAFAAYQKSSAAKYFATELAGKSIELWVVRRNTKLALDAVIEFWQQWIFFYGGSFSRWIPLQGIVE